MAKTDKCGRIAVYPQADNRPAIVAMQKFDGTKLPADFAGCVSALNSVDIPVGWNGLHDAKKNQEGKRRHVTYSHDAQPLFTLDRGVYAIFVTYGKVRKEFALTVKSGDRKKVDIAVARDP